MPKVGKKHFAYTDKGKKAAKAEAERTGKKVKKKTKSSYAKGGSVKAHEGYVVARGSGAARPQFFKVSS